MSISPELPQRRRTSSSDWGSLFVQGRTTLSSYYSTLNPFAGSPVHDQGLETTKDPFDLTNVIREYDLKLIRKVGGGGFADVYHLHHETLGHLALKCIREVGEENLLSDQRRVRAYGVQIYPAL